MSEKLTEHEWREIMGPAHGNTIYWILVLLESIPAELLLDKAKHVMPCTRHQHILDRLTEIRQALPQEPAPCPKS